MRPRWCRQGDQWDASDLFSGGRCIPNRVRLARLNEASGGERYACHTPQRDESCAPLVGVVPFLGVTNNVAGGLSATLTLGLCQGSPSFGYSLETQRVRTTGLPRFLHKKSQVGQPPIMPTLFEPRKPKTCRIEKQQYHSPNRIHRRKREPVVNRKEFARASHRGRRNQQE